VGPVAGPVGEGHVVGEVPPEAGVGEDLGPAGLVGGAGRGRGGKPGHRKILWRPNSCPPACQRQSSSTPPGMSPAGSYGVRVQRKLAMSRWLTEPSSPRTARSSSPAK